MLLRLATVPFFVLLTIFEASRSDSPGLATAGLAIMAVAAIFHVGAQMLGLAERWNRNAMDWILVGSFAVGSALVIVGYSTTP